VIYAPVTLTSPSPRFCLPASVRGRARVSDEPLSARNSSRSRGKGGEDGRTAFDPRAFPVLSLVSSCVSSLCEKSRAGICTPRAEMRSEIPDLDFNRGFADRPQQQPNSIRFHVEGTRGYAGQLAENPRKINSHSSEGSESTETAPVATVSGSRIDIDFPIEVSSAADVLLARGSKVRGDAGRFSEEDAS